MDQGLRKGERYMPSLFPMPSPPGPCRSLPRGVSLIELIVVLLIMIVVSGFTMGAIQTMRKNTKVGASADRITSLLHLARNLAISNNAMYFVRINAADGTNDNNSDIQFLSIYYFPKTVDAVTFRTEPDKSSANAWNPGGYNPVTKQLNINPNTTAPYNNVLVRTVYLEGNTTNFSDDGTSVTNNTSVYCGINTPLATPHFVCFNPDGSCGTPTMQLYVTDNKSFVSDDTARQDAINKSDVRVKTIRIFSGGMIKREF